MTQASRNPYPNSDSNKRYYTYDYYLRHTIGAKCAKLPENRLGKTPGLEIGKGPPREAVPVKRHRFGHLGGAVIPALDIPVERFSFRRVMALADNQKLPVRSRFVTLPHERL